jgi:hypothetical protein
MTTALEAELMARKAAKPKTTPVRLTDEAVKWARIASGYTGESMAEYISRIVAQVGKADAGRLHADVTAEEESRSKGKSAPHPKGQGGSPPRT